MCRAQLQFLAYLLGRIKNLQGNRDERDRKRRLGEKENRCAAKAVSTCSSPARQPCTAVLHGSVAVDRNARHSSAWQCGSRNVVHSFRCTSVPFMQGVTAALFNICCTVVP